MTDSIISTFDKAFPRLITTKMNWNVSWKLYDKEYSEIFEFRTLAEIKIIQLEAYGIIPILTQILMERK